MRWVLLAFFVLVVMVAGFCVVGYLDHRQRQEDRKRHACVVHLKQIEIVKLVWASKHHRSDQDVPKDSDLFGPASELKEKPVCPSGGVYMIGTVGEKPKCSIARHNL